jgi:acetolactate synthase-1/2/3 large subunit
MGAGVMGYDNPHSLCLLGMHGTVSANKAVSQADLVVALGARFSDRVALNPKAFAKNAKRVQVDIDKSEINKNVMVDASVVCDVKEFLNMLLPSVEENSHEEWNRQIKAWKDSERIVNYEGEGADLHPYDVVTKICDMTDKDTIYVTDVGQHQMWAAQRYPLVNPRSFITSGGLGTMGFGMGAAIGASMATGKRAVLFTGDGSFGMNLNELATAVSQNIPLVIVIMNNGVLGMVRQWQTLFFDKHYSNTTLERQTDFVKLAEAFGAKGIRVFTTDELREAAKTAFAENGTVVIDCAVDSDEFVLPMLPPGGSIDDIITEIN